MTPPALESLGLSVGLWYSEETIAAKGVHVADYPHTRNVYAGLVMFLNPIETEDP